MKESFIILMVLISFFTACEEENQSPACVITYPNNGDEFEQGDTIAISVEANDNDGLIVEVNFYIDDIGTFSSSSLPYGYSWNTIDETTGNHIIKVTAIDNDGGSKTDECTISIIGNATVITTEVSSVTHNSAQSGGNVTDNGGTTVSARGVRWGTSPNVVTGGTTDGSGTGSFTSSLTGLYPRTTYYVSAYATNKVGTTYGNEISFTTSVTLPTVTTSSVTDIIYGSATCGGNVTSDGGATVTERGIYYSILTSPETTGTKLQIGSGTGTFTISLTVLTVGTTYYVKAYATNNQGTAYGSEISFTTAKIGTITDYDGNIYSTVEIGNQTWMAENLKVTHYPDGTSIQLVEDNSVWDTLSYTDKAYCYYNNSSDNGDTYGALYTWAAAMNGAASISNNPSGIQGVCPDGWHLPSDAEWKQLEMYLGMSQNEADDTGWRGTNEGGKLKETGTTHWNSPNTGDTNESSFTALPGGYRTIVGSFYPIGDSGYWWSSTEYSSTHAWYRRLSYNNSFVLRYDLSKVYGFSVRCVKDD